MPSRNDKAAARARLNEADMEQRNAPRRRNGSARAAMGANRGKQRKNTLGGRRKSLIKLKTDKEIQAFSYAMALLDFDGFG
jgi:hypothetical protein